MLTPDINLIGHKYGELEVVEQAEDYIAPNGHNYIQWLCKCSCGKEYIARGSALKYGVVLSCEDCKQKK